MNTENTSANTGTVFSFIITSEPWWEAVFSLNAELEFKACHHIGGVSNAFIPF